MSERGSSNTGLIVAVIIIVIVVILLLVLCCVVCVPCSLVGLGPVISEIFSGVSSNLRMTPVP